LKIFLSYGVFIILLFAGLHGCTFQDKKKLPSLNERYSKTDKLPFGSFVAYQRIKSIFHDYGINVVNEPFDVTWERIKASSGTDYSLYFLITKNLILKDNEVAALINYVNTGNDIFISADYIDTKLLESLFCKVDRKGEIINEVHGKMRDTHVSMYFGKKIAASQYGYYYFPFLNAINDFEPEFTRVLGVNEMNQPNYALFFLGKGRIYLHVAPRIFSNYFLLTNSNFQYLDNVISYLRLEPERIYWDEYYKTSSSSRNKNRNENNDKDFSTLRVIKQHPPLLWAFCIALTGILLYVFFNLKRKQRVIEEIKPNSNATLAFTETVGRLYFQHQNNRHIADKMITYFYEYIRNKFFINTAVINAEFINSLSGKSGVSKKETEELFEMIKNIQGQKDITDEEILELNLKIENFNKNKT
jgi:hypothetical protein